MQPTVCVCVRAHTCVRAYVRACARVRGRVRACVHAYKPDLGYALTDQLVRHISARTTAYEYTGRPRTFGWKGKGRGGTGAKAALFTRHVEQHHVLVRRRVQLHAAAQLGRRPTAVQSRCRCGSGEPSPGADVAAAKRTQWCVVCPRSEHSDFERARWCDGADRTHSPIRSAPRTAYH